MEVAEEWTPPPVAPPEVVEGLILGEWATTFYNPNSSPAGDSVMEAIVAGTFTPPAEKGIHYEQYFRKMITPGDSSEFDNPGPGVLVYAARTFTVDSPTYLRINADRIYTVFVNGKRQPGDLYGSSSHRTPAMLEPGENLVILRGFGEPDLPDCNWRSLPTSLRSTRQTSQLRTWSLRNPNPNRWVFRC